MLRLASAADLALSLKKRADYFVIATVGLDTSTGKVHVLDIFRDRVEAPDQPRILEQHYAKWRLRGLPYVCVEKVGFQTSVIQYLRRRGLCAFKAIDTRVDKETRAMSLAVRYQDGQVVHPPAAPWLDDYEAELLSFPNGEHDDMVDAVCYAVDELTLNPISRPTEVAYHEFSFDASANGQSDESHLYAELGIT